MMPSSGHLNHLVSIGRYQVDLRAIASIAHECDPNLCRKGPLCCGEYEIGLDRTDVDRVVGLLPSAVKYAPHLRDSDGELGNPFDDDDDDAGEAVLDQRQDGICVLAFRDSNRALRCSLHAVALELGIDPYQHKPQPCVLWPLALSDPPRPALSVQDDAFRFPCNRRRKGKGLHPGVEEIIAAVFGSSFLVKVRDEMCRLEEECR